MKNTYLIFIITALFFTACKKDVKNSTTLGGDTNVGINTVGNVITCGLKIGSTYATTNEDIKVLSNDNGVLTIKAKLNLPTTHSLYSLLPTDIKTSTGIDATFQFKSTSEGFLDYINADKKPLVLVRYDAKVGDTYSITKSNGNTITRKVTAVSTDNDFPYGFYNIKVVTVEQDSRIPGVSKIIYKANHRFGLVFIQAVMQDGSTVQSYIYSKYENS